MWGSGGAFNARGAFNAMSASARYMHEWRPHKVKEAHNNTGGMLWQVLIHDAEVQEDTCMAVQF